MKLRLKLTEMRANTDENGKYGANRFLRLSGEGITDVDKNLEGQKGIAVS